MKRVLLEEMIRSTNTIEFNNFDILIFSSGIKHAGPSVFLCDYLCKVRCFLVSTNVNGSLGLKQKTHAALFLCRPSPAEPDSVYKKALSQFDT